MRDFARIEKLAHASIQHYLLIRGVVQIYVYRAIENENGSRYEYCKIIRSVTPSKILPSIACCTLLV